MTAELALGVPLLLAVTWALAWLLVLGVDHVRTVDAAREAARALARGDPPERAVELARRVAPTGAVVSVSRSGDEVRVEVRVRIEAPGGSLVGGLAAEVGAEAVALAETGAAAGPGGPRPVRVSP